MLSFDNEKFKVNFAISYGGRQEIIDAVKNIVSKGLLLKPFFSSL